MIDDDHPAGIALCAALGLDPTHITEITIEPASESLIVTAKSVRFVRDAGRMVEFLDNYRLVPIERPADD